MYVCKSVFFRQVIILDPVLIKAGTKQMEKMSQQLQIKTGFERHNALLQYYTESSFARLKAVWYIYIYIYINTHAHTSIFIYILGERDYTYIFFKNMSKIC